MEITQQFTQQSGFLIFRPNLLALRLKAKHTVVAAGSSRGGTSIISYALARAGFNLGSTADLNHEDIEILGSIRNKTALRKIFNQRNVAHDVWGFKVPEAAYYFDWLDMELRNPIFIYVMRNPASIARSIMLRDPIYGTGANGYAGALSHGLRYYIHFAETLKRIQSPVLIVEYEAILQNPIGFCSDFYSCLGIELENKLISEIAEKMSKPGYKTIEKNSEEKSSG